MWSTTVKTLLSCWFRMTSNKLKNSMHRGLHLKSPAKSCMPTYNIVTLSSRHKNSKEERRCLLTARDLLIHSLLLSGYWGVQYHTDHLLWCGHCWFTLTAWAYLKDCHSVVAGPWTIKGDSSAPPLSMEICMQRPEGSSWHIHQSWYGHW